MQWRFLFLCLGHDVPREIRKNIFVAAEDELLSNQRPRTYFFSRCTAERLDKQRRQYHYIIAVVISKLTIFKLQISSQITLSHCISPIYKKKLWFMEKKFNLCQNLFATYFSHCALYNRDYIVTKEKRQN